MPATLRLLILPVVAALACLALRAPAAVLAHASLVRSQPAGRTQLGSPPSQVDLFFAQVFAVGGRIVSGEARIDSRDGKHLVASLAGSLDTGAYTVFWKTTSDEDGGVSLGNLTFFVQLIDPQLVSRAPAGGQVFVPDADQSRALAAPSRSSGSAPVATISVIAAFGGAAAGGPTTWLTLRRTRRSAGSPVWRHTAGRVPLTTQADTDALPVDRCDRHPPRGPGVRPVRLVAHAFAWADLTRFEAGNRVPGSC